MFISNLIIESDKGLIRDIKFKKGLNLIIDDSPKSEDYIRETGNNV